jgi:hypothetical protein
MSRYGRKYQVALTMSRGKSDISNFDINAAVRKEENRAQKDWSSFDPKGCVYLIGNKTLNFYKIGLTRNTESPDSRFKAIQQGIPFDLDFIRYWFVNHAESFERLLHYEFQDKRIRGEWFKFSFDDIDVITLKIKTLADKVPPPPEEPL